MILLVLLDYDEKNSKQPKEKNTHRTQLDQSKYMEARKKNEKDGEKVKEK